VSILFKPNPLLRTQLLVDPQFQSAMDGVAQAALEDALAHVPVDTGALKASLHVEDGPDGGKRVVAGTDHWLYVEFGTSDQAPESFLRPIIANIGLKPT
jgi:bacteriophage HK97-gp10 putative tail-component